MAFEWFKKKILGQADQPEVQVPVAETEVVEEQVAAAPVIDGSPAETVAAEPIAVPQTAPAAKQELEVGQRSFANRIRSLFTGVKFDPENLEELEDLSLIHI